MKAHHFACAIFLLNHFAVSENLCTDANIQTVARVVFGEARGEPTIGQRAVAYTIVNRINHAGYPNTLLQVVNQKYGNNHQYHQYNTLDDPSHDTAWANAKSRNTQEYRNAVQASNDVLCGIVHDPTDCAVDYCAFDPCSATESRDNYPTYNKQRIGSHYFVCRSVVG